MNSHRTPIVSLPLEIFLLACLYIVIENLTLNIVILQILHFIVNTFVALIVTKTTPQLVIQMIYVLMLCLFTIYPGSLYPLIHMFIVCVIVTTHIGHVCLTQTLSQTHQTSTP